jgi:thymidylate synthase
MNTLDNQYHTLLERILRYGIQKDDRTGTGTLSVFGGQFIHEMSEGFPLLTTKKMAVKTMMTELKWFLKGDTNIKYLVDNGCNIWNGDAYKNYEKYAMDNSYGVDILSMDEFIEQIKTDNEFARKWGELGPIYGSQWRSWTEYYIEKLNGGNPMIVKRTSDQIENLINELKRNPDSRRLMVSAWNVGELDEMVLPPCHYGFQVYTRKTTREEKITNPGKYRAISLMWNQRSVDTFLGLPFNIASYGTLLQLLADECDMVADQLIGNLGDIHIYNNHIEQVKEQLQRSSFPLPTLELSNVDILNGEFDYKLNGYESHPSIKAPLSN